jgi:hypothetical protein
MTQPRNPSPGERDRGRRAGTPSPPTPEDPRQNEPMHDPPVNPEHDIEREEPVRQARGVETPDPSPDNVIVDANETER